MRTKPVPEVRFRHSSAVWWPENSVTFTSVLLTEDVHVAIPGLHLLLLTLSPFLPAPLISTFLLHGRLAAHYSATIVRSPAHSSSTSLSRRKLQLLSAEPLLAGGWDLLDKLPQEQRRLPDSKSLVSPNITYRSHPCPRQPIHPPTHTSIYPIHPSSHLAIDDHSLITYKFNKCLPH